jgi:hypothetical protein
MWIVYTIIAVVVIVISVIWVKGITDMHEKYPDYKGDDLSSDGFNFDDEKEENKITNDSKRTNKKVY